MKTGQSQSSKETAREGNNQTAISLCPIWHRNNISLSSRQLERQQYSSTTPKDCYYTPRL